MTLRDFPGYEVRELLKGHRAQVPLVPVADGDGAVFRLPLAEHQHVGNAVQTGIADFGVLNPSSHLQLQELFPMNRENKELRRYRVFFTVYILSA